MTPIVPPDFRTAARFWAKLGFISFGGPAGQIAIMHREIVERRRWVEERAFTDALNFCMLLPGPEALQLAIYLGWRMHGLRGGLVAGLGFILPAVVLLFALSIIYVTWGELPWLAAALSGLEAAVIAVVAHALLKLGRRTLHRPLYVALAVGAFVALQAFAVPFPLVLLAAALVGMVATSNRPPASAHDTAAMQPLPRGRGLRVAAAGLALWAVPLALVVASLGLDSLFARVYLFFTQAALITFGGAYAVLAYVTTHLVEQLQWITAEQSVAGLALAETTPGPLVIVLQFLGFAAGWNQPGGLPPFAAALLAGALASWATFLPSFVLILVGAPHVERLTRQPRIAGALAAITAAVVGVIATLAVLLLEVVVFPDGWLAVPDWRALLIAVASGVALVRFDWPLPRVLGLALVAGLLLRWPW